MIPLTHPSALFVLNPLGYNCRRPDAVVERDGIRISVPLPPTSKGNNCTPRAEYWCLSAITPSSTEHLGSVEEVEESMPLHDEPGLLVEEALPDLSS